MSLEQKFGTGQAEMNLSQVLVFTVSLASVGWAAPMAHKKPSVKVVKCVSDTSDEAKSYLLSKVSKVNVNKSNPGECQTTASEGKEYYCGCNLSARPVCSIIEERILCICQDDDYDDKPLGPYPDCIVYKRTLS